MSRPKNDAVKDTISMIFWITNIDIVSISAKGISTHLYYRRATLVHCRSCSVQCRWTVLKKTRDTVSQLNEILKHYYIVFHW